MNKRELSKVIKEISENVEDLESLYLDCNLWDVEDFIHNSELVVNMVHDVFDKISVLQNKYTTTDGVYLEIVVAMEEHLEEGKLFKLKKDIDLLKGYLYS